ncbi:MAG: hypothetical protein M5U34_35995 [Chloroflexi bacterium]|nr:hypothetical protein [Chloroflexota bacterium]
MLLVWWATKVTGVGEFVLAEMTQTFDHGDSTYFLPLMGQVEQRLMVGLALARPMPLLMPGMFTITFTIQNMTVLPLCLCVK